MPYLSIELQGDLPTGVGYTKTLTGLEGIVSPITSARPSQATMWR